MTAKAIAQWLEAKGYSLGYQVVARHVRRVRSESAAAKSAETFATAIAQAETDLIGMSMAKLLEALDALPDGWQEGLKPSELFTAIARLEMADIQRQKWQQALKDRMDTQLASVAGKPGIDEATLKQVRETIYGIFD
jgi:hypothetical protein